MRAPPHKTTNSGPALGARTLPLLVLALLRLVVGIAARLAPGEAAPHLALEQPMARELLAEDRRSVWNLRVPASEGGEASDAFRGLVARLPVRSTAARFDRRDEPWTPSTSAESVPLRAAQQALVNVGKHVRATSVGVRLGTRHSAEAVRLVATDDGVGFGGALGRAEPMGWVRDSCSTVCASTSWRWRAVGADERARRPGRGGGASCGVRGSGAAGRADRGGQRPRRR